MDGGIEASPSAYQILRELGRGGMAEVMLARRCFPGQDTGPFGHPLVALKRLKPELANDAVARQMLVEEARLGAGFNHPNLVEAYDLGEHRGQYFFTMELVHGHELRHLVRAAAATDHGRIPLEHVLTIVASIAAGLNYAHDLRTANGRRLNVVHLDVCPSNVLVGADGFVKLIDFGIARHDLIPDLRHDSSSGLIPVPSDREVRRGTMAYMSPEQCVGRGIDRRSDVFSLGVILWELTTWQRLYRAPTRSEVFEKIVEHDAPRPTSIAADYPVELEAIVMQALARDPEERFANARALLVAIEEFAHGAGIVTSTTRLGSYLETVTGGARPEDDLPVRPLGPTGTHPGTTLAAQPLTTAPYGTAPVQDGDPNISNLARRFQPISRRWRQ